MWDLIFDIQNLSFFQCHSGKWNLHPCGDGTYCINGTKNDICAGNCDDTPTVCSEFLRMPCTENETMALGNDENFYLKVIIFFSFEFPVVQRTDKSVLALPLLKVIIDVSFFWDPDIQHDILSLKSLQTYGYGPHATGSGHIHTPTWLIPYFPCINVLFHFHIFYFVSCLFTR